MNKERPYLHFDSENSYTYHLYIALLPLILYGFYKNGLLPFLNHNISILGAFRPILFPLVGFLVGIFVDYIIWWGSNKENIWTYNPLYGLLIGMTCPIKSNLLIGAVLLLILFYLGNKIQFIKNKVSPFLTTKVIFYICFILLAGVTFLNSSERAHTLIYSTLDTFFGRSIGGISTTSIFWILISYGYLWFDPYYKKEIPIYIIITFGILSFLFELIIPTGDLLKALLNSSVFFASVFFATEMVSSPYTEKGRIVYGIAVGIIGFFSTRFLHQIEGIYLSIWILSLFVPIIDQICYIWDRKKQKFCRMPNNQKEKRKISNIPKEKK